MIRSLRTGMSGLRSHQVRMDVIGNNIANANSTAFKRSRAAFNEVLGQQMVGVGSTAGGSGINPAFVGLGTSVGSIDKDWGQGGLEYTSVETDLALEGDGYFMVERNGRNLLTRAGNFTFNSNGEFMTANGLNVQGFRSDPDGVVDMSQLADIQIDYSAQSNARFTREVAVGGNLSAEAPEGTVETISQVVYDEQGNPHNMIIELEKTDSATNTWDYTVRYGGEEFDPAPFGRPGDYEAVEGEISFGTDGRVEDIVPPGGINIEWNPDFVGEDDSGDARTFSLDLDRLSQFGGSTTVTVDSQDGYTSGQLVGFTVDPDGMMKLNFSNGQQEPIFQIAISSVNNPNGLEQLGENFYGVTGASGEAVIGRAGREVQTSVVAGALEQSNVDLAVEFTDMIVAQRGYQASARVITTSDELLQETLQLKR